MKERANAIFPFAIACALPPAGLFLGLLAMEDDRGLGARLLVVSVLAAAIWVFVVLALG
ncbi:MAG: hypothetical protein ABR536_04330 [Solirubrobacterales bacterium]